MSVEQFETEVLELGVRKVRTPEGADKYGLPIGAIITPDAEAAATAKGYTDPVPEDKVSGPRAKGGFMSVGTISGKAQAEKSAPKPAKSAEPKKLKLKISKSSIKGNKVFMVGKSKYSAPNGSKLIRPANQPGMAYVVTPEGKVHAFNEAGEITIPDTLKAVFENKFNAAFEGDDNYSVEEFDATAAPYAMEQLQAGAVLNDKDGNPQFKKTGPDAWEHVDLGVQLKDEDLKQLYEEGDLVPEQTEDSAVAEETFGQTEAVNFKEMSASDAETALDAMPAGQKVTMTTPGAEGDFVRIFTKGEDGSWQAEGTTSDGNPFNPSPSSTLAYVKDFLSIGAEKKEADEPDPEKVKEAITGEKTAPKLAPQGPGIKDYEAALNELPEGHQVHVKDSSATLTKNSDGSWKSSVTGEDITPKQAAGLGTDLEDGPSPTSKPAAKERKSPFEAAPTPEPQASTPRSTSKLKPGEGDYEYKAKSDQMAVATIGDRVLVSFDGGSMVSEYELTDQDVWENVDDKTDSFGKKTMAAMVADQGTDQVYINSTKQSKPLSADSGEINYGSPLDTTDVLYDPNMAYDVWNAESEFYAEPAYPPFTDEATLADFENAQPGDKFLVAADPEFDGSEGSMPNYLSEDLLEKQPDGTWKSLTFPTSEVDENLIKAAIMASESEFQDTQLYSMKKNSTKRKPPTEDKPTPEAAAEEAPETTSEDAAPEQSFPLISDTANAKKIGEQAGSNEGGLYELTMPDGSKQKYYVKKAKTEDHGKNEALANALYTELGLAVPEVTFASDGNLYSKIVDGEQDMSARLNDKEWLDKVRDGFAADAWLSNRDVFGLTYDNILTDADGNPWRIDNGGALRYRAMGEKKTDFGPEVTELDVFQQGKKAAIYGPSMSIEDRQKSAQKIADLTPERIQELVSEYGMDDDMAQTLLARRESIMEQLGVIPKAADVPAPPAADALPSGTVPPEAVAVGVPSTAVQFPKTEVPEIPEGATVYEVTPNGNVLASVKLKNGNYSSDLGDGLLVESTAEEVFGPGPEANKFYFAEAEQPAAPMEDWEKALMEPFDSEPVASTSMKPGDKPNTVEDFNALPAATTVGYEASSGEVSYYTKLNNGMWLGPTGNPMSVGLLADPTFKDKYTIKSIPGSAPLEEPDVDFGYAEGDPITLMAHVNAFPVGQELAMVEKSGAFLNTVVKTESGWRAPDDDPNFPGLEFTAGDMGDAIKAKILLFKAPAQEQPETWNDLDTQLWSGAPAVSKYQIQLAIDALTEHPGFQVSYGMKKLPKNHPLVSPEAQEQLKSAAMNKYPTLKAKPAVLQYLKDANGIEESQQSTEDDTTMVRLGSKDPKSTGVQGVDGGTFSVTDIKDAIAILESYNGKLFKAELNKKGNKLGSLNPNSLVGFDKDKTVVKQKFIDLLKSKLIRTEEAIKHPKVKSMGEFNELPVGSVVSIKNKEGSVTNFTKVSESQWRDEEDNPFPSSIFKYAIDTNDLRLEKLPDVLPDYAKTPAAVQAKGVSEAESASFGPADLDGAEVGTEIVGVNDDGSPMVWKKTSNVAHPWDSINPDTGEHIINWSTAEVAAIWDLNQIKLKQIEGPNFNQNAADGIVPGKYESKTGKAYMVVNADGSGVYVNSKGTVSKLSKNAVKKNYELGVSNYKGIPDTTPTPGVSTVPETKKPVTVADLADGTYFAGDPTNPKTVVYEVSGDKTKVFKPNTSLTSLTGVKVGKAPNQAWREQAGVGAAFETSGIYIQNAETGEKEYAYGVTFTKGADGLWTGTKQPNTKQPPQVIVPPTAEPPTGYGSTVTSHGLADPVEMPKSKVNTLFAQGKLVDDYGNSVLPEGYTGGLMFFTRPNTVPALVKGLAELKELQAKDGDIDQVAINAVVSENKLMHNTAMLTKWRMANGFEDNSKESVLNGFIAAIEKQLEGLDLTPPESNAAALFDWNEMGQAKYPASAAAVQYQEYDKADIGKFIKAASASIGGGKIIGQHLTKMDLYDRRNWVEAFKAGNFKKMYELEVAAAALENKPHAAGFLHPGYGGNEGTNQIIWGPAVDGEISAGQTVPGEWTIGAGLNPSLEEVDNYLIAAQMQNPTYLTNAEKREWVRWHQKLHQPKVDELSSRAQQRKLNGEPELTPAPTWTDDIKPAKLYDSVFENDPTPWPTGSAWRSTGYDVTQAWARDNADDPDFKAFYSDFKPGYDPTAAGLYEHENIVAAYFDMKRDEYEAELLKPVYKKTNLIGKGSHEVWDVEDQFGRQYVFKPADSPEYAERLRMEAKANDLALAWGFPAAKSFMVELDGEQGMMQQKIPSESSFYFGGQNYLQVPTLNNKQLAQLSAEHVLDWMLDNDDNHADNMLVKGDGTLAGIDKGRSFYVYGNWPGLTADEKAHTVFSDRSEHSSLVYTYLYNDIRAGKLTPEQVQAAYFGARKAAMRIQKSSDAAVEQMVRDAVEGRTNWSVPDYMKHFDGKAPTNADELVAAVLARKNGLAAQIDEMWGRIYSDAGLGDLPQAAPKVFEGHISGWDEPGVIEAASEAKVWGAAPLHSSAAIVNGHSLLWTEQSQSGDEIHKGMLKVGALTQQQLVAFLQPKAQNTTNATPSQSPYLAVGSQFPQTAEWKSSFTAAAKNITTNAVDKNYDPDVMAAYKETAAKIEKDLAHWSPDLESIDGQPVSFPSGLTVPAENLPQYKLMLLHYQKQAELVKTAEATGGTTNKTDFTVFQPMAYKNFGQAVTSPDGKKYTELVNGQWMQSDGAMVSKDDLPFDPSSLPDGWTSNQKTDTDSGVKYSKHYAGAKLGVLSDGGIKVESDSPQSSEGHGGEEYRVTLPTGEVINFRNANTTNTLLSQQGTVSFRLAGDDKQASLERVKDQLELMGLDLAGATETDAELNYWRAMFDRVLFSTAESTAPESVKAALKKLKDKKKTLKGPNGEMLVDETLMEGIGLALEEQEELEWWRELAGEAFGKEKVSEWLLAEKYLPKYHHMDLSDVEKNTGMPFYSRIDVDVPSLKKKNNMIAIGNSGKDKSLLLYIQSGGMISTEERLRILGHFKEGKSSSDDQPSGGATNVFARVAKSGTGSEFQAGNLGHGEHVAYWSPDVFEETGTYAYASDTYGRLSARQGSNPYDPLQSLNHGGSTDDTNEVMIGNSLSIYDHLEIMVFESASKRNEAIQKMKELGLDMLRGLPIEDRFVMRVDLKQAIAKAKAQWKQ